MDQGTHAVVDTMQVVMDKGTHATLVYAAVY